MSYLVIKTIITIIIKQAHFLKIDGKHARKILHWSKLHTVTITTEHDYIVPVMSYPYQW